MLTKNLGQLMWELKRRQNKSEQAQNKWRVLRKEMFELKGMSVPRPPEPTHPEAVSPVSANWCRLNVNSNILLKTRC
jgi:hypothetical protein